jgi:hypothetical protein
MNLVSYTNKTGARCSVVGWGTMLQAGRSRVVYWWGWFFNWPNPFSRTLALGSIQPLTQMSTRNIPGGKGRPEHKADNLTAICEPIFSKMWKPRPLKILWASTACYSETFNFLITFNDVISVTAFEVALLLLCYFMSNEIKACTFWGSHSGR